MNKKIKLDKKSIFHFIIIILLTSIPIGFLIIMPETFANMIQTGIDYKGITEPIPDIISTRSMNSLKAITENDDLLNYYELIEKEGKDYVDKYEVLNKQDIYVLKSNIDKNKLEDLLVKSEAFYSLLSSSEELKKMGFKPDATVINYYMGLTEDNEIKNIYSSLDNMDSETLNKHAINFILSEYNDLNYDNARSQRIYLISTALTIILFTAVLLVEVFIIKKIIKKFVYKLTDIKDTQKLINSFFYFGGLAPIPIIYIIVKMAGINQSILVPLITLVIAILMIYMLDKISIKYKAIPKFMLFLDNDKIQRLISLLIPIVLIIVNIIPLIAICTKNISLVGNIYITICYIIELVIFIILYVDFINKWIMARKYIIKKK